MHSSPLLFTLAVALSLALVLGAGARALKLPPLVGYLLAGVAVGPHTPGLLVDTAATAALADVGVALLLFGVGLHFEFADLLAVRKVAVPGALGQTLLGIVLGGVTGWATLGLTPAQAAVFGLALSIASTAIATRLLAERQQLNGPAGRTALGWLVVQDLLVVLALVLLPALAGTGEGGSIWLGLGKALFALAAFAAVMLLFGRRALPWLLARAARSGSIELFTLAVVAVALGVAWTSAELFGVSLALGAFFAGVVLGETDMSHQAAARALPLEHIFAVLFFVSVGMQFDPAAVVAAPMAAAAVVLAALLATGGATFLMLLLLRQELRSAAQVAVALAGIGEFSFVLAELAIGRGLLPEAARGPILLTALVLVVLNPGLAVLARRGTEWLRQPGRLPGFLRHEPTEMAPPQGLAAMRDHAIIIGHGRVGSVVAAALVRHGIPYIVVEGDHRLAERLRTRGVPTIWGDATDREVLAAARPEAAKLLVIALPLAFQAQHVMDLAREVNPRIDIAVRAHADDQVALLSEKVGLVVMGEREVGLSACDYALRRFGLDAATAQATVDDLRAAMPG